MRLSPSNLSPRRSLVEQGLGSVMTVVVRQRLEKRFGCRLPSTPLWHQPTISAIVRHLADLRSSPDSQEQAAPVHQATGSSSTP